ncbi:hypothetical protein H2200_001177 [Cladophialophora chaetospira]|uniref:Uncharacterized protein n=1 Tax=Cladophialophora chaetospira TaxID=386627 RepID=A0AA38XLC1_9EURO|nr:hypothetical protein H2200_001177 [Cladophialophora chaetospira]
MANAMVDKEASTIPPQKLNWEHHAYFENSFDALGGVICRPDFEARLQAHFGPNSPDDDGAAWYALRNTVYATGLRILESKQTKYAEAQRKAWRFFENALSVFVELVFAPSGIPAVQAVAAMAIDDDDISCQIPTSIAQGSSVEVLLLTHKVKLARISSRILRRLTSVKAFQQSTDEITQAVAELTKELEQWRNELPASLRPGTGKDVSNSTLRDRFLFAQYFDYAFHASLVAIHQVFAYPWIAELIGNEGSPSTTDQVAQSTQIVAEAARNMILLAKDVKIQASAPQWLVFFCPMVGTINLFITILKDPFASTARADIALLDVAVGHFGNMEIVTEAEMSFPFVREVAGIAYRVVREAEGVLAKGHFSLDQPPVFDQIGPTLTNVDFDPLSELDPLVPDFDDMQGWNFFTDTPLETVSGNERLNYFAL